MIRYFAVVNDMMNDYVASWGRALHPWVITYPYRYLDEPRPLPPGTYVFSDVERLAPEEAARYGAICDDLLGRGPAYRVLNHPARSMRRYELLQTLHASGVNDFSAWRPGDDDAPQPDAVRYPVFLRQENDHDGPRTARIEDAAGYRAELARARASHGSLDGWLTTEFCDVADGDGVRRKYSSFFIAGRVIPRHVLFSHDWVQKNADLCTPDFVREEREYVETNPDAERIAALFRTARIDYGRIDHGRSVGADGAVRLHVWEINTNPCLVSAHRAAYGERTPVHASAARSIAQALLATVPPGAPRPSPLRRLRSWATLRRAAGREASA